jgi:bla regulator protein blaR1
MMEKYVTSAGSAFSSGLGNHLWQSTLVALIAGLLTLALRKHHARARYGLWLAASLKFLVPFSLLVELGQRLTWTRHSAESVSPGFYFAIDQIGQPFSQSALRVSSAPANASIVSPNFPHFLPFLAVLWLGGFLAVVLLWTARWFRIFSAMKSSIPLDDGREVQALRRVERIGGRRHPIPLLLSRASLEPGIFGIARPTLIWPDGISKRLDQAHLEAILAHEVRHVRRRDNLSATLHMLVEAVFWFYPLVWWLGARLVEERERACDEEVVALGSDREVYAQSILRVCEFCLGSPLPCVSGITGADLKKRMVHIMNDRILQNLGLARKLLLTVAAALAIALPVTFGLFNATPGRAQAQAETATSSGPVYSSVSVKPSAIANTDNRTKMMFSLMDGRFVANGVTLERLIQLAYHVQEAQISGPHDFLNKTKFDIEAKLAPAYVQQMSEHKGGEDQGMIRSILADQFKLVTHSEARALPTYDLVVDENGAKLQPSGNEPRMMHLGRGELTSSGTPLELLAAQLSARLGRPVVDKTGLEGNYAFNLHWTPDQSEAENLKQSGELVAPGPPADPNGPSLVTALQNQLGLKLQPNTEPVEVLVIDHAEEPTEN